MAKLLEKTKVAMGRLLRVANLSPRFGQNEVMCALNVEDQDGSNERWLLFTELEAFRLPKVTGIQLAKPGRLYHHHKIGGKGRSLLSVMRYDREEGRLVRYGVALSDTLLRRAEKRAAENPEDIPEKTRLEDLLD